VGYYSQLTQQKFRIKKENKDKALKAIYALAKDAPKMGGGSWGPRGTTRHFSWVVTNDFALAKTLEVALRAWRWDAEVDDATGDIHSLEFTGEKLGDDSALWDAVAPFVEHGSYLQMAGEDGMEWRWVFNNGKMKEVHPVWPDE
jgi:hypothetical protein